MRGLLYSWASLAKSDIKEDKDVEEALTEVKSFMK
jgi:hypothetical protein